MHTLSVQTKFTFGDRVRFDSPTQSCSGSGTIFAINIDARGEVDYVIEQDDEPYAQGGILENEITLLAD